LFEANSPKSLGDAIRLLVRDFGLRARLGAGAADKIRRDDISWARNARRAMSLIRAAPGQKH
jgi:glycosyltransferase involved in cell wall biosynthesis